jgi:hypothetical protein
MEDYARLIRSATGAQISQPVWPMHMADKFMPYLGAIHVMNGSFAIGSSAAAGTCPEIRLPSCRVMVNPAFRNW